MRSTGDDSLDIGPTQKSAPENATRKIPGGGGGGVPAPPGAAHKAPPPNAPPKTPGGGGGGGRSRRRSALQRQHLEGAVADDSHAYPPSSFTRRCFNGNWSVTVVPRPGLLSTAIWPPWARMIRCTTIMPRPWPVGLVVW